MSSIDEYSSLMSKWNTLKEETRLELEKYQKLVKELKTLKNNLDSASKSFKNTEKKFLNGAFIDDGLTFDKGELKKYYETLDANYNTMTNLISEYELKISALNKLFIDYDSKYFFAKKSYNDLLTSNNNSNGGN